MLSRETVAPGKILKDKLTKTSCLDDNDNGQNYNDDNGVCS